MLLGGIGYWDDLYWGTDIQPAEAVQTENALITATTVESISSLFKDLASIYGSVRAQEKLLDINLERARLGLPPIDTAAYSPSVNVGVTPQTQQLLTYALIGVLALGAFALMRK
jgi:hypothetical protein